jgi:uncharacterized protein (UPF0262 family)
VAKDPRIVGLVLDERNVVRRSAQVENDRKIAIYDILDENCFDVVGEFDGPFNLRLSVEDNRLIFDVQDASEEPLVKFTLPLTTFRSVIRDYFMICESYNEAIKMGSPSKIEAIDMGRRGLHNEGSELLANRLADKVKVDTQTARRLFTFICVLHIRA